MANKLDVLTVIEKLTDAYQDWKIPNLDRLADTWTEALEDVPADLLMLAAKEYVKTKVFQPKPAELRELALKIRQNNGNSLAASRFDGESPDRELSITSRIRAEREGLLAQAYAGELNPRAWEDLAAYCDEHGREENATWLRSRLAAYQGVMA